MNLTSEGYMGHAFVIKCHGIVSVTTTTLWKVAAITIKKRIWALVESGSGPVVATIGRFHQYTVSHTAKGNKSEGFAHRLCPAVIITTPAVCIV